MLLDLQKLLLSYGFDFDATVKGILSVPADEFPPFEELERRPKRKNGESRAKKGTA